MTLTYRAWAVLSAGGLVALGKYTKKKKHRKKKNIKTE
jgi:hypothetical protein